jgi:hypothetical protein
VTKHAEEHAKDVPFLPGDPVFVVPTSWVGLWSAFSALGEIQPGKVSTHEVRRCLVLHNLNEGR